mmetsp:Transcript_134686/g.430240  ORF Transcript_134686/g.430240 Transcript_134686/m.430240 type:complete len:269 (-) Transcript_134686:522-1328(-)
MQVLSKKTIGPFWPKKEQRSEPKNTRRRKVGVQSILQSTPLGQRKASESPTGSHPNAVATPASTARKSVVTAANQKLKCSAKDKNFFRLGTHQLCDTKASMCSTGSESRKVAAEPPESSKSRAWPLRIVESLLPRSNSSQPPKDTRSTTCVGSSSMEPSLIFSARKVLVRRPRKENFPMAAEFEPEPPLGELVPGVCMLKARRMELEENRVFSVAMRHGIHDLAEPLAYASSEESSWQGSPAGGTTPAVLAAKAREAGKPAPPLPPDR